MYKEIIIKREELYNLIWTQPMTEVSKQYGVSDKAIAKIYFKLSIPTPGNGYWRKIEVGQEVKKIPLPEIPPNHPTTHTIRKFTPEYPLAIPEDVQKLIDSEIDPRNKIIVPSRREWFHKLIKKTELALYLVLPRDKFFTTRREAEGVFDLKVGSKQSRKALRLLDTLIKELEVRNHIVFVKERKLFTRILGVDIAFILKEKSKRITLKEKPDARSFGEYDFIPTGEFILSIDNIYVDQRIQKNFIDNKVGKLEEKLNDFIVALIIAAPAEIASRKHHEQKRRRCEEEERKKMEAEEKLLLEKKKIEELEANAVLFQKSRLIREHIEEYKKRKSPLTQEDEEYIR
jgi:hypothetical protein